MELKAVLMDDAQIKRSIIRISHEILEKNKEVDNIILVGIQRRGLPLANEIAKVIKDTEGKEVKVGVIDITLYRDDLSTIAELPLIKKTDLPFNINNANIVLVDDVLFTGRTVMAGMEVLKEHGRPKSIQLAVLIDRGGRELPIGANYVGKEVPSSKDELVSVSVVEIDEKSAVEIFKR